jgi:ADP-heptose:LPS heptosyltransferase
VHFLTKKSFKAVTEANPYIDKFYYYDDNLGELIGYLKKEGYNYIIDLHKNFRTAIIKWRLDIPVLSYHKESFQKWLLTKFGINRMSGKHISDRCLDVLASLGVVNDGWGLDYSIPTSARIKDSDLPMSHRAGYIAIVIGASYATKKLPISKLQELCAAIQFPIILVGGKEDATEGEAIANIDSIRIYNACGKFSLHESADIVRLAKTVISHDTGLLYIACALNKKTLAIWGGTSPKLDVEPYYGVHQLQQMHITTAHKNFVVEGLACQPCSNYGTKKCPKGHFKCMLEQDISAIANAI